MTYEKDVIKDGKLNIKLVFHLIYLRIYMKMSGFIFSKYIDNSYMYFKYRLNLFTGICVPHLRRQAHYIILIRIFKDSNLSNK